MVEDSNCPKGYISKRLTNDPASNHLKKGLDLLGD
jgi:hypothetical protein